MKKTSFQLLAAFLMLAFCGLATSQGFAQTKGTLVKTRPTDSDISVTKTFEFRKGGLTVTPLSGDVSYTVYEKASSTTAEWSKTDSGTLTVKDGRSLDICNKTADRVKVEIKAQCDRCVDVKDIECGK